MAYKIAGYNMRNDMYNPKQDADKIKELKQSYEGATTENDRTNYAEQAKKYYQSLYDNGYGSVADNLHAKNAKESGYYLDKFYQTAGKTQMRPYMKAKGAQYGIDDKTMDNLITWDGDSGTVSFAGRNIGAPYANVDGTTYWNPQDLDKVMEDYVRANGLKTKKDQYVEDSLDKYSTRWDDAWNENMKSKQDLWDLATGDPFKTSAGKAILAQYERLGDKYGYNAAATGAAANSGNIDSFAAANAMRTARSLMDSGMDKALDWHKGTYEEAYDATQSALDRAKGMLSDLGVRIDNTSESSRLDKMNDADVRYRNAETDALNSTTATNNFINRNNAMSAITGEIPTQIELYNRGLVDINGNVVTTYDFSDMIDSIGTELGKVENLLASEKAKANPDSGLIAKYESQIADLKNDDRLYRWARQLKTSLPGFSSYANDPRYSAPGNRQNYTSRDDAANRESAERISTAGNDARLAEVIENNASAERIADKEAQNNIAVEGAKADGTIKAMQAEYELKNGSSKNVLTPDLDKQLRQTITDVRTGKKPDYDDKTWKDAKGNNYKEGPFYKSGTINKNMITAVSVIRILNKHHPGLTSDQLNMFLTKIGYSEKEISDAYSVAVTKPDFASNGKDE